MFPALNKACVRAFGSSVTYRPAAGDPFPVRGIFSRVTDEERHMHGVYVRLFLDMADLPALPDHGDEVVSGSTTYTVFDVARDEGGGVFLWLREKK